MINLSKIQISSQLKRGPFQGGGFIGLRSAWKVTTRHCRLVIGAIIHHQGGASTIASREISRLFSGTEGY